MIPADLAGSKVLVVGLGRSGRAAATLARAEGARVVGVDTRIGLAPIDGVVLELGPHRRERFAEADLIVAGHYHALRQFFAPVGDAMIRQIIAGTGGADQGLGIPRYGYLRVELSAGNMETCFVEIPPLGSPGPLHDPADSPVPYCD